MSIERLDKILSRHGFGTRKDVKKLIHTGVVFVNNALVTSLCAHIDTDKDSLMVDNEIIEIHQHIYLLMNKPVGCVCSARSDVHETVFGLLTSPYNGKLPGGSLHIIGRLDVDTEGLLLLTTDGNLTHRLISPKTCIGKTYYVELKKTVTIKEQTEAVKKIAEGIFIEPEGDEPECSCKPAYLEWKNENSCLLTIREGKYHQVKRMFKALGNKVVYLKRISIGKLHLDENLKPGEYRELSNEEYLLLTVKDS